jgi:hypothetical protein
VGFLFFTVKNVVHTYVDVDAVELSRCLSDARPPIVLTGKDFSGPKVKRKSIL